MFKNDIIEMGGINIPVYSVNTLIVGSGAASLNCADHLYSFGVKDIVLVTDYFGGGASNLSGSDKQTYYKLSLSGEGLDSPYEMAKSLFDGGCMHGDIALIESTLSPLEFYHLCQIGVEFPHNKFGGYTGYKTDHDPRQRATSAGPRTSHQMVQRLAEQIKSKGIPVMDNMQVITILTSGSGETKKIIGALAIDKIKIDEENFGLTLFNCENLICGVGGPGGIYKTSVYPLGQIGGIGIALKAGAIAQNLTESQYGLASTKYRWNVSGTYQQVIPKYISTDENGNNTKEFLNPFFENMGKLATDIFLKGYQWPFDSRKVKNYGSSIIDILVYQEQVLNKRKVFMDLRGNPTGTGILEDFNFSQLEPEAYKYLENSLALFGSPIDRLLKMNPLAIDLYKEQNIDITSEPLEVAVCSQHNNGGLSANIWWESNIKGLFPVGEINGSHGVYRPGGAALNSGQVGSFRAAQYISEKGSKSIPEGKRFLELSKEQVLQIINTCNNLTSNINPKSVFCEETRDEIQYRMTAYGSHIREYESIKNAVKESHELLQKINNNAVIGKRKDLITFFENDMLCLAHIAYLESIHEYLENDGGSRGSYLIIDPKGEKISDKLDDYWKFKPENTELRKKIMTIEYVNGRFIKKWIPVNAIPADDFWYENVWRDYREKKIFQ